MTLQLNTSVLSFDWLLFIGHRKTNQSSHSISLLSGKYKHKSHKHKHSLHRKDSADPKGSKKNEFKKKEDPKENNEDVRRPRSNTFNATTALALMPLCEIAE